MDDLHLLEKAVHDLDVRLARVEAAALYRDRLLWWVLGMVTLNTVTVVTSALFLLVRR